MIQKLQKIKEINKTNVVNQTIQENIEINNAKEKEQLTMKEVKHEINKSLKELKEMAIVLRQKLDTLESEKNVMEVEYSQVNKFFILAKVFYSSMDSKTALNFKMVNQVKIFQIYCKTSQYKTCHLNFLIIPSDKTHQP